MHYESGSHLRCIRPLAYRSIPMCIATAPSSLAWWALSPGSLNCQPPAPQSLLTADRQDRTLALLFVKPENWAAIAICQALAWRLSRWHLTAKLWTIAEDSKVPRRHQRKGYQRTTR